jgi:peroxiredoxin
MSNLSVGSRVPEFSIYDSEKQPLTNETIAGKTTLILFFPAAFTSVCTKELCAVRDDLARYNQLNVQVIGISTDTLFTLAKFKEEQGLNFTLASDYNKEMCAAFGAQYSDFVFGMKGTSRRAAFVIDDSGVVRYAEVLESAGDIPNFEAINQTLAEMKQTA